MSEEITTETLVAGENVQPVTTDTDADTKVEAKSETNVAEAPQVEIRDGKTFLAGVRVYSRDDTNRIAARAKDEAVNNILADLEVDSLDQIKGVVSQLRNAGEGESTNLNIQSLKDSVKKKEQTVEELRSELQHVRTEYALKEHIGSLKDNMPTSWNVDQKQAVIDLMKARDMLHLQGETFAIKNGEDFITTDGETPDYKTAVEVVGKNLGLPFAKQGVATFDADKQPDSVVKNKNVDTERMSKDPQYRSAYVNVRSINRGLDRREITDKMVTDYIKRSTQTVK